MLFVIFSGFICSDVVNFTSGYLDLNLFDKDKVLALFQAKVTN